MKATIGAGQSLSSPIDLTNMRRVAFIMPAAWTSAVLSFQACDTIDGTYKNVLDSSGSEINYTVTANTVCADLNELAALSFIKIRSGLSTAAVLQTQPREIVVLAKE